MTVHTLNEDPRVGICGDRAPALFVGTDGPFGTLVCELPHGHAGWHEANNPSYGYQSTKTHWSGPEAAEAHAQYRPATWFREEWWQHRCGIASSFTMDDHPEPIKLYCGDCASASDLDQWRRLYVRDEAAGS